MNYRILLLSLASMSLSTLSYAEEKKVEYTLAANIYSSGKATAVGDLVTITILESSNSSKSTSTATSKAASSAVGATGFTNPAGWQRELSKLLNLDGLSISNSNSYSGAGDRSNSESLQTTFTARVIDILPNKNLLIRGERMLTVKGEKTTIALSGIIRSRDIKANNTIDSEMVSDARISYQTKGNIDKSSEPGVVWRFFSKLNPF